MKKGQIAEGNVTTVEFPNKGIVMTDEGERVIVKNTIPGQRVSFAVNKVRKGKAEGRLLETVKKSPRETADTCRHFGQCGGCTYQSLPYEEQLKIKETQVRGMIEQAIGDACAYEFLPIRHSPRVLAYRNKMEFSFGDEYKDGPLALGMHKRGSFYDIVTVEDCRIVDGDFRAILMATLAYFREQEIFFYHRLRHTGYLRHLLVRKAVKTGEILVDLITTTQDWRNVQEQEPDERAKIEAALLEKQGRCPHAGTVNEEKEKQLLAGWKDVLLALSLEGTLKGVLHTKNDSVADVVKNEGTEVLFGQDYFYEELLGLRFQISPFSFFQTNSLGAEVLYSTAREFILGDNPDMLADKTVYDLYSGTGTIAQMLAPVCKKVVGVEIIEEAVEAAKENAALNHLDNCEFLAGYKTMQQEEEKMYQLLQEEDAKTFEKKEQWSADDDSYYFKTSIAWNGYPVIPYMSGEGNDEQNVSVVYDKSGIISMMIIGHYPMQEKEEVNIESPVKVAELLAEPLNNILSDTTYEIQKLTLCQVVIGKNHETGMSEIVPCWKCSVQVKNDQEDPGYTTYYYYNAETLESIS